MKFPTHLLDKWENYYNKLIKVPGYCDITIIYVNI